MRSKAEKKLPFSDQDASQMKPNYMSRPFALNRCASAKKYNFRIFSAD